MYLIKFIVLKIDIWLILIRCNLNLNLRHKTLIAFCFLFNMSRQIPIRTLNSKLTRGPDSMIGWRLNLLTIATRKLWLIKVILNQKISLVLTINLDFNNPPALIHPTLETMRNYRTGAEEEYFIRTCLKLFIFINKIYLEPMESSKKI